METQDNLQHIFRMKAEMLCNGIIITQELITKLENKGIYFNFGRKGGAGPAGGRYFRFPNGSIVNTPIWIDEHPSTALQIDTVDLDYTVHFIARHTVDFPIQPLYLIPVPKFYEEKSTNGLPFKQIALMHGDKTLATTLDQKCVYWRNGSQCKFCGIEFSLESGATIQQKTPDQFLEALKTARKEDPEYGRHLTITIGTQGTPDKGMANYIGILQAVKSYDPSIGIHVQIEPMHDMAWYAKVHDAGADTIGIHLEVLTDSVRAEVCPGKSAIPKATYYAHWKKAIEVFGPNQVDSFILTGFEQDLDHFKDELRKIIEIGVVPVITPAKYIEGVAIEIPTLSTIEFRDIVLYAAQECHKNNVDPTQNRAGCVKCEGCSAIIDAYRLVNPKTSSN